MYRNHNVKLINKKKRNSKYCNTTLSIKQFQNGQITMKTKR